MGRKDKGNKIKDVFWEGGGRINRLERKKKLTSWNEKKKKISEIVNRLKKLQ